jgi:hypothetical protein
LQTVIFRLNFLKDSSSHSCWKQGCIYCRDEVMVPFTPVTFIRIKCSGEKTVTAEITEGWKR